MGTSNGFITPPSSNFNLASLHYHRYLLELRLSTGPAEEESQSYSRQSKAAAPTAPP